VTLGDWWSRRSGGLSGIRGQLQRNSFLRAPLERIGVQIMAPRRGRSGLGIQDTGQEDPPSPRDPNLPPLPKEDPHPEQLEEHGEDLPAVDGGRAVEDPAGEDQIRAEEEARAREELVAQARA
jgi:hypothetical protein